MGYVLTGATLIDGNGGEPLANAAVHVKGRSHRLGRQRRRLAGLRRRMRSSMMSRASGCCPA